MGKHTARLEERAIDSAFHEFRVDYEQAKNVSIGQAISSNPFSAGGYMWRVHYFPNGVVEADEGKYLSIMVQLVNKSRDVNAIFEAFILGKDGEPCYRGARRSGILLFQEDKKINSHGWPEFISQADLKKYCLTEGHIVFACAVMVVHGRMVPVPPSDIKEHFGKLLGSTDGTDVSFTIDGETFHAHRAVLAARSPVFKAELLGSMVEATMSSITLHDIAPATFRVMLQFMYTAMTCLEMKNLEVLLLR